MRVLVATTAGAGHFGPLVPPAAYEPSRRLADEMAALPAPATAVALLEDHAARPG